MKEAVYTAPEELGRASIRYFAQAVGDHNPLYTDDAYARQHGHDGVIAPPTLIFETNQYTNLPRDADGFAGHSWHLDVPGAQLVRGGNAYTYHQPVRPSDVVTAAWRVAKVEEKAGMTFVTSTATYSNQHGQALGGNEELLVYVPPRPPRQPQPAQDLDGIPPLERTIELQDMIAYAGATWDWHRLHYDPPGGGRPVVDGQVFGALLAEQLQDWLGPTATITSQYFRFTGMVYAGETVRCTGRVVAEHAHELTVEQRVSVGDRLAVGKAGAKVRRG